MTIPYGVRGSLALAISIAACGGDKPKDAATTDSSAAVPAQPSGDIPKTQSANRDPCSWISRDGAEKALGATLLGAPTRVRSVTNTNTSATGSACLYELPSSGAHRLVSIEIAPDESGALQAAFMGMGSVEEEFKGSEAKPDTLIDGRWDFVSEMPGGLTAAKSGRVAVQMVTSLGGGDQGMRLASAIVDGIPDLPFTNDPGDPAVAPHDPDPCKLITRTEAEAQLGPLVVAPYRSAKGTAIAYGNGQSCSYFSGKHRALVVTPKWTHGADMFRMLGGVAAKVAEKVGSAAAPDTLEGSWDQISIGSDGTMHVLKGDKLLSLQYKSSAANYDKAVALVRTAISRLH